MYFIAYFVLVLLHNRIVVCLMHIKLVLWDLALYQYQQILLFNLE